MASTPNTGFTAHVHLPKSWVECPLCGLHYVFKGRESRRLCNMVDRLWWLVSTHSN